MKPFILSFIFCLLFVACKTGPDQNYCPYTHKCDKSNGNIKFEGYKIQETDTIMLTTYIKDGTFRHVVNSMSYYSYKNGEGSNEHYNVQRYLNLISSDYDYDIFVPAVNRHYRISNIVHSTDSTVFTSACAGNGNPAPFPGCSYAPASATIDGVPFELEKYTYADFKLVK